MDIEFYVGFDKKPNSTKRPGVNTVKYTLTGTLKEPSSVLAPVVNIQNIPVTDAPSVFTYASIPRFFRYYFVKDWVWNDGLWTVRLEVDVLATYKAEIGNTTEYVLRTDSTTDFNGDISDTVYPTTTDVQTESVYLPNMFVSDIDDGFYVVGIISGNNTDAVGAVTYYAMIPYDFGQLKQKLFSNDNLEIMGIIDSGGQPLIQDLSQEVLKTMYNPYQYIVSCMWFPFKITLLHNIHVVHSINIGWWSYPLSGNVIHQAEICKFQGENAPVYAHPQSSTRGDYLNYSPYTKRTLMGRFGTIALDTFSYRVGDGISVIYYVDVITGLCRVDIGRTRPQTGGVDAYDVICNREFLLGVPIQIAQVGVDHLGMTVNAIETIPKMINGAAIGALTGTPISSAISAGARGIYNTIQAAMPQVETSGSNGSFISANYDTAIITQHFKLVDEDIHHKGRPLCEIRTLNTLSGFILCAEGDIDISCFDDERKEIARHLTSGFFWE